MAKIQLRASSADQDTLWSSIHTARDDTRVVKVDKGALERVLFDIGAMAAALGDGVIEAQ